MPIKHRPGFLTLADWVDVTRIVNIDEMMRVYATSIGVPQEMLCA